MKGPANVVALLLFFGMTFTADAEYLIKFSHTAGSDTAAGRSAAYFADQVNKRLAGKLRVEVFPDGKLYDDAAVIEAVGQASGDTGIMATPSISRFSDLAGGLGIFGLPFLFDRIEDVHRLVDSPLRGKLLEPLQEKGITGLTVWDEGMKVFSVRGFRPLRKPPDDFRGKKLATSGSEVDKAVIEALGGEPRELAPTEVFRALSQGDLDGQESLLSHAYQSRFHEVQDWISVSDHVFRGFLVVVGTQFWNGLPAEMRDELTTILDEATVKNRELVARATAEDRELIEESGTAIILGLTSSERDNWRNATADVETRYATSVGEDLIAEVRALLRQPVIVPAELPESLEQPEVLEREPTLAAKESAAQGEAVEQSEQTQKSGSSQEAEPSVESGPPVALDSAEESGK